MAQRRLVRRCPCFPVARLWLQWRALPSVSVCCWHLPRHASDRVGREERRAVATVAGGVGHTEADSETRHDGGNNGRAEANRTGRAAVTRTRRRRWPAQQPCVFSTGAQLRVRSSPLLVDSRIGRLLCLCCACRQCVTRLHFICRLPAVVLISSARPNSAVSAVQSCVPLSRVSPPPSLVVVSPAPTCLRPATPTDRLGTPGSTGRQQTAATAAAAAAASQRQHPLQQQSAHTPRDTRCSTSQ